MSELRTPGGPAPRDSAESLAELQALKARVIETPNDVALRLELAIAYRDRGFPDQAGRWSILAPGWATDVELDRFARLLASSRMDEAHVRAFLLLPESEPLPAKLTELLARPVPKYVKQFKIARMSSGLAQNGAYTFFGSAIGGLLMTALLIAFGTGLIVGVMAGFDSPFAAVTARIGGTLIALCVILSVAAALARATMRLGRRDLRS